MVNATNCVQLVLSWSLVAFAMATVVLAVQKANLDFDLKNVNERLDYWESQEKGADNSLNRNINYRLPSFVMPTYYNLVLDLDIDGGTFSGDVSIDVDVIENTQQIVLHAHKLLITSVNVFYDGTEIAVSDFSLDTEREFLIIDLGEELKSGLNGVVVRIYFSGEMQDKIVGLYSSSYLTEDKERRVIATSKFEPTYARQAFPCFDEPAMKANYTVTLRYPHATHENYFALSNMNEKSSVNLGDYTEVTFHESVPMSSYLVCMIVSDFAYKTEEVNTGGIGENFNIRIFSTEHQKEKVNFALSTAVAVTEFYIRYFQVEYPLPKLDMAAIPDFVSNAMEHWGLVTYRETALLYDKDISSTWNMQRIAAVVAHELGHMWFGNLVTMGWWNDLWLNEGFARYMEYKSINEIYTDWGMPEQFLIHALHGVLKFDSSVASHPIRQTVENPDQITEIFDTISYEKGASVIRMLEDVIGSELFAQAVTNYLNKFKFKNAITDDFVAEVSNLVTDFDVKLFMRTWTEQMGLPVVDVKYSDNDDGLFSVTQKRFFSNIEDYDGVHNDSNFNYKWTISLSYYTDSSDKVEQVWFNYNDETVTLPVAPSTRWIKVNVDQKGYYRVNYEANIWQEIINDLIANPQVKFSISDRAHLLNDAFALADGSQLSYDIAMDLTKYLVKENDFVPWHVATTKLQALYMALMPTDIFVDYAKYARKLITNIYNDVTWTVDDGNHLRNRLRVSVLTTACWIGAEDCLETAAERFRTWLENPQIKPEPDLRELIYYYGMQRENKQLYWERMWQLFVDEEDASEKTKLMYGLAAVREPWLLFRYIELAANEEFVRRQDYFSCLQNIAANPVGEPIVWDYVRENWPKLVERFGLNERYLGRMIPSITERFATVTRLNEMEEFFAKYPEAGAGTAARKQALETVKYNIKWLEENKQKLADWLLKENN